MLHTETSDKKGTPSILSDSFVFIFHTKSKRNSSLYSFPVVNVSFWMLMFLFTLLYVLTVCIFPNPFAFPLVCFFLHLFQWTESMHAHYSVMYSFVINYFENLLSSYINAHILAESITITKKRLCYLRACRFKYELC